MVVEPYEFALDLLMWLGIDFNAIYNGRGGMHRAQLATIVKLNAVSDAQVNAYKTIKRLHASPNAKNLNFAGNLKNTLTGTLKTALMDTFDDMPIKDKRAITIRWLPSSAHEHRAVHALNYGKTMTMDVAIKKGLGVDYGCQCSFEVISGEKVVEKHMKKFKGKVKK